MAVSLGDDLSSLMLTVLSQTQPDHVDEMLQAEAKLGKYLAEKCY